MSVITLWVILSSVALLIGYDLFAFIKGGKEATISQRIWDWSFSYPIIPFLFGALMSHFFWR